MPSSPKRPARPLYTLSQLEGLSGPHWRTVVAEFCALADVPLERWTIVDSIARPVTMAAWELLARRLVDADGYSRYGANRRAARLLRINFQTQRSGFDTAFKQARCAEGIDRLPADP